jgi:hypothetical protein
VQGPERALAGGVCGKVDVDVVVVNRGVVVDHGAWNPTVTFISFSCPRYGRNLVCGELSAPETHGIYGTFEPAIVPRGNNIQIRGAADGERGGTLQACPRLHCRATPHARAVEKQVRETARSH